MTAFKDYQSEDLLLDESFLEFCKNPESEASKPWRNLIAQHPPLALEAGKAQQLYSLLAISAPFIKKESLLEQVQQTINEASGVNQLKPVHQVSSRKSVTWLRYAAAAAIVGIMLFAIILSSSKKATTGGSQYAAIRFEQTFSSSENERREVTLPDGSTATLNYGSTLKVAQDYNKKERALYLDGEAFFSVKKDATRPFIVITKHTATTALGTAFKVRSYPGEEGENIMLASGKVKVEEIDIESKFQPVLLEPGEEAKWTINHELHKDRFDPGSLADWRVNHIVFDKADLRSIVASLEFNYGVQVRLENNPANAIGFTGKFDKKSLKDVLEAIAYTNKFSYSHHGNIVSIRFQ